jgi:hypothetical protein
MHKDSKQSYKRSPWDFAYLFNTTEPPKLELQH